MALPTGPGTETLHSHLFEDFDTTSQYTILHGVQHHVYTILNITVHCVAKTGNYFYLRVLGYDSYRAESGQGMQFAKQNISAHDTWVFNDKIVINGGEPTDFANATAFEADDQIAVAAQAVSTSQKIQFLTDNAADNYSVFISYIDQDWT